MLMTADFEEKGVCVCVYVIYVNSTLTVFPTIPVVDYLRLPGTFTIPDIHQIQYLTCYTPIIFPHRVQILDLVSYRRSLMSTLGLAPPRRKLCHHRPIYHLRLLPDLRPFVARATGEQAV